MNFQCLRILKTKGYSVQVLLFFVKWNILPIFGLLIFIGNFAIKNDLFNVRLKQKNNNFDHLLCSKYKVKGVYIFI